MCEAHCYSFINTSMNSYSQFISWIFLHLHPAPQLTDKGPGISLPETETETWGKWPEVPQLVEKERQCSWRLLAVTCFLNSWVLVFNVFFVSRSNSVECSGGVYLFLEYSILQLVYSWVWFFLSRHLCYRNNHGKPICIFLEADMTRKGKF